MYVLTAPVNLLPAIWYYMGNYLSQLLAASSRCNYVRGHGEGEMCQAEMNDYYYYFLLFADKSLPLLPFFLVSTSLLGRHA